MAHTPGPWKLVDDVTEGVWIAPTDDNENVICDMVGRLSDPEAGTQITDEDMENARLIAAAPDLLGASKAALEWFESKWPGSPLGDSGVEELLDQLEAAIAKVEEK